MDCRVLVASAGDFWVSRIGMGGMGQICGGFSHESEHDLGAMVSDFLENESVGAESWCSSDSDSGISELSLLGDKIPFCKCPVAQYECDLISVVHSHILSITKKDLKFIKSGACYASCIRFHLVKLLRDSGYDACVCSSKWQGSGKVPGGDHEYIDVVNYNGSCGSDRLIIDIDFQSHFEIARAVDSYNKILNSLPVVYVGSYTRLKQFLVIMVEAAKTSLKQNSMPLPPWRSLAYLQAKWQSPFQRQLDQEDNTTCVTYSMDHKLCTEHLRKMKSSLQSEIETDRLVMSRNSEHSWRLKPDRWRHSLFRPL